MPDGSTTVVGTRQGQTINYILGKLCEKRGLSVASVDVFLLGSEKVYKVEYNKSRIQLYNNIYASFIYTMSPDLEDNPLAPKVFFKYMLYSLIFF
jgi:hypothetical protein